MSLPREAAAVPVAPEPEEEMPDFTLTFTTKLKSFIIANEEYVEALETCEELINAHLDQKAQKESAMRAALKLNSSLPVSTAMYKTPYFQEASGTVAPIPTSEVEAALYATPEDPNAVKQVWGKTADARLSELVLKRKRELRQVDLGLQKKRLDIEINKLKKHIQGGDPTWDQLESEIVEKKKLVDSLTLDISLLDKLSYEHAGLGLLELKKYDWFQIAQDPVLKRHGELACELRFFNQLDPALAKGPWIDHEVQTLRQLLDQHGQQSWDAVAQELPGRTALDCCRQFRRTMTLPKVPLPSSPHLGFSADEVVRLLHGYIVAGGNRGATAYLPHRQPEQCYRYLHYNLNLATERSQFTTTDLRTMMKFGRETTSESLMYLYRRFPNRTQESVRKQFLELFRRDKNRWVEINADIDPIASPGQEAHSVLIRALYEHVATNVTTPLREDLSLTLDELVTQGHVVLPVIRTMADLNLFTSSAPRPDLPAGAVLPVLSKLDCDLFELFSSDLMKKPKRSGRPRKTNPFAEISEAFQAGSREEKVTTIQEAIATDEVDEQVAAIVVPPSYCTMDGLLKLKELCRTADDMTEDLLSRCDPEDLRVMHRRAQSLFLTSEIVVQQERSRPASTPEPEARMDTEEGAAGMGEPVTTAPTGKFKAKNKLMAQRFSWFREKQEREAKERRLKREQTAANRAAGIVGRKRRPREPTGPPVRQSGRLTAKITSEHGVALLEGSAAQSTAES